MSSSLLTATVLRSSTRVHLTDDVRLSRMLFEGVTVHIRHTAHFSALCNLRRGRESVWVRYAEATLKQLSSGTFQLGFSRDSLVSPVVGSPAKISSLI